MAKKSDSKKKAAVVPTPPKSSSKGSKSTWKMLDRGSNLASGLLAKRVATVAWRGVTGRKPPVNGQHPDVGTAEAVAWAMIGGGLVELVRVGVRRGAATYWVRSTGDLPPGMASLTPPGEPEAPVVVEAKAEKKGKLRRRSRDR